MNDEIRAPWSEKQVAALNAFQRSGRMHPFTCGGEHRMHQTLIAEADGWHCPDETCDYRQNWAHAFMADPATLDVLAPPWPEPPDAVKALATVALAQSYAGQLRVVRQQLRTTEEQLGAERQANAALRQRLEAAEARVTALEVHTALSRVAAADVPCGELLHGQSIADIPTGGLL